MECRVCTAETTGFLYKISACRACAAFFYRTAQMKLFYRCKKERNCPIDRKLKFCRYCRMKKCLAEGMVTDGSEALTDYYIKGIQPAVATTSSPDQDALSDDDDELPKAAGGFVDHAQYEASMKKKISKILKREYRPPGQPFKLNICQQSAWGYERYMAKFKQVEQNNKVITTFSAEDLEKFFYTVFEIVARIAEFFMDIEPFAKLPFTDKVEIYKKKAQHFCDIAFVAHAIKVLGTDVNDTRWVLFDGHIVDILSSTVDLSPICNKNGADLKEFMDNTYVYIGQILHKPFKQVNPDNFELQYLLMKSLWNLEGIEGLSTETLLLGENIQNQLDEELSYYYNYEKGMQNVASRIYKIHNLITAVERVVELRESDKQVWKTFDVFKFDLWIDDLPD